MIASTNRSDDLGALHTSNESIVDDSIELSAPSLPKHVVQTKTVRNNRRITTPQHIIDATKENCIYQGAGKRRQLRSAQFWRATRLGKSEGLSVMLVMLVMLVNLVEESKETRE